MGFRSAVGLLVLLLASPAEAKADDATQVLRTLTALIAGEKEQFRKLVVPEVITGPELPPLFVSHLPARARISTDHFFEMVQGCALEKLSVDHVNPSAAGTETYPMWAQWKCGPQPASSGLASGRLLNARLLARGERVLIYDVGLFSIVEGSSGK